MVISHCYFSKSYKNRVYLLLTGYLSLSVSLSSIPGAFFDASLTVYAFCFFISIVKSTKSVSRFLTFSLALLIPFWLLSSTILAAVIRCLSSLSSEILYIFSLLSVNHQIDIYSYTCKHVTNNICLVVYHAKSKNHF